MRAMLVALLVGSAGCESLVDSTANDTWVTADPSPVDESRALLCDMPGACAWYAGDTWDARRDRCDIAGGQVSRVCTIEQQGRVAGCCDLVTETICWEYNGSASCEGAGGTWQAVP